MSNYWLDVLEREEKKEMNRKLKSTWTREANEDLSWHDGIGCMLKEIIERDDKLKTLKENHG